MPLARNQAAFTIVEALVCLVTVVVVVTLVTGAVRQSRKAAKTTADLSLIRNNATSTLAYTADFRDAFPFLGSSPEDVMVWWYKCLIVSGHAKSRREIDPYFKDYPEHIFSRFDFTLTTALDPSLLVRREPPFAPQRRVLSMKTTQVRFPSQKGMIVRAWDGPYFANLPHEEQLRLNTPFFGGAVAAPVAGVDGAAQVRSSDGMVGGSPQFVLNGIGQPFYTTWGGVWGIDW